MRSKREIEKTLQHLRSECRAGSEENAIWIKALEWVLGDEEHRAAFDKAVSTLVENGQESPSDTISERVTKIALNIALERLR